MLLLIVRSIVQTTEYIGKVYTDVATLIDGNDKAHRIRLIWGSVFCFVQFKLILLIQLFKHKVRYSVFMLFAFYFSFSKIIKKKERNKLTKIKKYIGIVP